MIDGTVLSGDFEAQPRHVHGQMKLILLALILAACLLCQPALATGVEVKVFGPLDTGTWGSLALGPDGAVWFCCADPARVFRIQGDQMQQVLFRQGSFVSDLEPAMTVTPDGAIWFAQNSHAAAWMSTVHLYFLTQDWALQEVSVDLEQLPFEQCQGVFSDSASRLYALIYCYGQHGGATWVCRIHPGDTAYLFAAQWIWERPVFGSSQDAWLGAYSQGIGGAPPAHTGLYRISTESRQELAHYTSADGISDEYTDPRFIDTEGRLWVFSEDLNMGYMVFDSQTFSPVFPEIEGVDLGDDLIAAGDLTLWISAQDSAWNPCLVRVTSSGWQLFNEDDGLPLGLAVQPQLIDFDGNLWGLARNPGVYESAKFVWRLADGGWPPMRLMLYRLDTPESISVEAQVINNGPVVGVDVYVALQMNGQLLFWPNWQPELSPVQVNLRPGHNQTATIISAPRSSIPPGTYTFFSCMTGRNTQKLIGPLDRKFESLTIQVN